MVEALNILWNIFLIVGLTFLIFVLCFAFFGTIYNLLIGNKKKQKALEKAKEDLFENLNGLIKELEKCSCEECEEPKKKTTKKSTKKESE